MQKFKSFLPISVQPGSPGLRWTKITALLLAITLVFPHLAWAFEYINLSNPKVMIFNNRPVEIPKKIGKISRTFHGQDQLVIHIEDLHCNYEIQSNIAKIIDHLARWHTLRLVTMEGADKPVNVAKLSAFPIEAVKKEVGEYFIKQGKISGAEFYAATGRYPIDLEGIENPEHYRQGRELVSGFLNNESQGYVHDLRDMLEELKKCIYSPELFKFDAKKTAWREGRISSLKYCIFLKQRAVRSGLKGFPLIKRYVSRGEEVLWPGLDPDQLYQEIERLDGILRAGLYTRTEQRELDQHQRRLDIMEKLLNISATPVELAEYQEHAPAFQIKNFQDFIQGYAAGKKYPWDPGIYGLDRWLEKARAFYANADQRSLDFITNLLARMEHYQAQIAVLITGGYHTPMVLEELEQRNISFISVQPGLTRQDLVNPYFSLLREQRTPLEKLLSQDQKVIALEPFFAQWDKIRIKADQLPAEVRLGYDLLEMTLKLDYIHYLQEKGVAGLEGLQAEYRQEIAEYEKNSQRIKLNLNRVLAGDRFFAVPFEGASYFAVLSLPGQSPVSGAFQTMLIKDDLELTFYHKPEWNVMAEKIKDQPIYDASHALVRRRLLQAVCPGGEPVIFAGEWLAPRILNWMKRRSQQGKILPAKIERTLTNPAGGLVIKLGLGLGRAIFGNQKIMQQLILFFPVLSANDNKTGNRMAKKTGEEENIAIIQETAAYRLLETLGLLAIENNPAVVIEETVKYPEYTVRRIRIPERADTTKPPRGLEILQNEIADIVRFDLLYNRENQLIAIFPALPLETNSKSTHIAYNGIIKYFDLGEYYLKDSEITVPEIEGKWEKMYAESESNIRLIKSYLKLVLGKKASSALMIDCECGKRPYAYISVDRETGKWQAYEVGMQYKKHPDVKPHLNREEIIIPVYPTVYSPGNPVADVDDGYYNYIYKHMGLRLDHKVMVVGPGSGSDTWTISRKTGGKVWAVGINPLEVANTVQTAVIGGFEVDAVVGNNIIDEMGHSVFPGQKFNRIVWCMPHFSHRSLGFSGRHPSFSEFWDPDFEGEVLKRFVKGLPLLLEPDGYAIIWNKNIPDTMLQSFEGVKIEKVESMVYKIILTEPASASVNRPRIHPGMFNLPFYIRHLKILQHWRLPRALGMFILASGWLLVQTACRAFPRLKISGTDKDLDPDSSKELNLMKLRHGMPGVRFRTLSGRSWWKIWGMITGLYRENEQTPATIYAYPPWLKLIQAPELKAKGSLESRLAGWRYALTRRLLDNCLAYHRVDYLNSGTGFWERNLDKLFRRDIPALARHTLARHEIPGFGTRMVRLAAVKLPWLAGFGKSLRLSILKAYPDWEIKKILESIKAGYPKGMTPNCLDGLAGQFNRPESGVYQAYQDMVRASPKKFTQEQTEFFRQLRNFMLPNQTDVPERMPDNIAIYLELISRLDFGPSFEIGRWSLHDQVPGYLKGRIISLPISMKNSPGARELIVIISMLRRFQPWIILNNKTMEEILYPRNTPCIFEQAA